jgi:hypothetical protein
MFARTTAALVTSLTFFMLVSGCESSPPPETDSGCRGPEDCEVSEYCRFEDGGCGQSSDGVCEKRPERCDANLSPVWGCNDQMYGNECGAALSGQDVSGGASEDSAKGRRFCDAAMCDPEVQYCRLWIDKPYKLGECRPLPGTCIASEVADCDCLAPVEPSYDSCDLCDYADGLLGLICAE